SKVVPPVEKRKKNLKRKSAPSSDSDYDVEQDVPTIKPSAKRQSLKRKEVSSSDSEYDVEPDVPTCVANAQRWKFVYHGRLAMERELGKDVLEREDIMDLIKEAGLLKTVWGIGPCYEKLVKEFLVNIPEDCDNPLSKEFHKVFVRGKCVEFSPAVINKFLGRSEEPQAEVEVTDNDVCKAITANQVKVWPKKGKMPAVKLTVKYAILNRIGAANWVPTT
ncbi:envelope-like protein, partial [Trifolium medium]|nr:envelope-like protein [Trifolium medium]